MLGNRFPNRVLLSTGALLLCSGAMVRAQGFSSPRLWRDFNPGPAGSGWIVATEDNPYGVNPITTGFVWMLQVADTIPFGIEPILTTDAGLTWLFDINVGSRSSMLLQAPTKFDSLWRPNGQPGIVLGLDDGTHGTEPWLIADGGVAQLLADLQTGPGGSDPYEFSFDGETHQIFFPADVTGAGVELCVTDGTPSGTRLVHDINPNGDSNPVFISFVRGKSYFAAENMAGNRELWCSDGTAQGTRLVKEIRPGPQGSEIVGMEAIDDTLYFGANDGVNGTELWKSDGTTAGTVMVADIFPGPAGSIPFGFTELGDRVVFVAFHLLFGTELWITDGTAAGTQLLADIAAGPLQSVPRQLTSVGVGDKVMMWAWDSTHGLEPRITDGQTVTLINDFNPGPADSAPVEGYPFFRVGTRHVIFAQDDGVRGAEPVIVDVNNLSIQLLADIYPGPTGSDPETFRLYRGTVYFDANHPSYGDEAWTLQPGATSQPAGLPCAQRFPEPNMTITDPVLGQGMTIYGDNAPVGALSITVFGAPALQALPFRCGCLGAVDISRPLLTLLSMPVTQPEWTAQIGLPPDPSLSGLFGAAQTVYLGAASCIFELTNGVLLNLGM